MGEIRKVGDSYYIEFYARGLMYFQIAGSTQQEAQLLLAKVESTIAAGEALTSVRDIDVIVFVEDFLSFIRQQDPVKTQHRFQLLTTHFLKFLKEAYPEHIKLSQITPTVVESYKHFLKQIVRPKVLNFTLLLLRDILDYGIKIGFINDNPTLHVSLLPWPKKIIPVTPKYLKVKELVIQGVSFVRIGRLMKISDIARMMHFTNLIPLSRKDMV